MTNPNCVLCHVGVYPNALVSFVKMNIDHFFGDQIFLVEPFLAIKKIQLPNFPSIKLGNQIFQSRTFGCHIW
jgi:hypothetical protein